MMKQPGLNDGGFTLQDTGTLCLLTFDVLRSLGLYQQGHYEINPQPWAFRTTRQVNILALILHFVSVAKQKQCKERKAYFGSLSREFGPHGGEASQFTPWKSQRRERRYRKGLGQGALRVLLPPTTSHFLTSPASVTSLHYASIKILIN